MAGANFIYSAFKHLRQEKGRDLTEQEKADAYRELLPIAQNTALWEAGPEAIASVLSFGAGKIVLGIGRPAAKSLAQAALTKGAATAAALVGELGTETITKIGQDPNDRKLQQYAAGEPMTAEPDWSPESFEQAFREVAPQTLALGGLLGGAALGGKAIHSALPRRSSATPSTNPSTNPSATSEANPTSNAEANASPNPEANALDPNTAPQPAPNDSQPSTLNLQPLLTHPEARVRNQTTILQRYNEIEASGTPLSDWQQGFRRVIENELTTRGLLPAVTDVPRQPAPLAISKTDSTASVPPSSSPLNLDPNVATPVLQPEALSHANSQLRHFAAGWKRLTEIAASGIPLSESQQDFLRTATEKLASNGLLINPTEGPNAFASSSAEPSFVSPAAPIEGSTYPYRPFQSGTASPAPRSDTKWTGPEYAPRGTIPKGLSKEQFGKFSRAARQVARRMDLPKGELVVHGSRASGNAAHKADIDIALRVDRDTFFNAAAKALAGVPRGTKLYKQRLARINRKGLINSYDLGHDFQTVKEELLGAIFPYETDFSIVLKGGSFDNGPFIPLGDY